MSGHSDFRSWDDNIHRARIDSDAAAATIRRPIVVEQVKRDNVEVRLLDYDPICVQIRTSNGSVVDIDVADLQKTIDKLEKIKESAIDARADRIKKTLIEAKANYDKVVKPLMSELDKLDIIA